MRKNKIEKKRAKLIKRLEKDYFLLSKVLDDSEKSAHVRWNIKFAIRDIKFLPESKFRK